MSTGLWAVLGATIGLSFLGFVGLVLAGYSRNRDLDKGEMRRAITGFLIVIFGLLVASSFFPIGLDVPSEIKGIFAGAVTTIIGFYFGSRVAEEREKPEDNHTDTG